MKYLKDYRIFINENMNQAKSIMAKKMEDFENLKKLLSKNIGYIGKFTEFLMNENVPYKELENLYKELISLKNKQVNLDISKLNYEKTLDLIQSQKENLSINSLINQLTSEQKKIARELILDEKYKNLFYKASISKKIESFVVKSARYKTKEELINAIKIVSKEPVNYPLAKD